MTVTARQRLTSLLLVFAVLVAAGALVHHHRTPRGDTTAPSATSPVEQAALDQVTARVQDVSARLGHSVTLTTAPTCGDATLEVSLAACHDGQGVEVSMPPALAPAWVDLLATGCAGVTLSSSGTTREGEQLAGEVLHAMCNSP